MEVPSYQAFARRLAGKSFDGGLYRFHDGISGPRLASALSAGFPAFAERAVPFAFDWLGRQFAIDRARMEQGEPLILLIEPGTGKLSRFRSRSQRSTESWTPSASRPWRKGSFANGLRRTQATSLCRSRAASGTECHSSSVAATTSRTWRRRIWTSTGTSRFSSWSRLGAWLQARPFGRFSSWSRLGAWLQARPFGRCTQMDPGLRQTQPSSDSSERSGGRLCSHLWLAKRGAFALRGTRECRMTRWRRPDALRARICLPGLRLASPVAPGPTVGPLRIVEPRPPTRSPAAGE